MSGTPKEKVEAWLAKFDAALKAKNIDSVKSCFDEDCYWRDLVSFTWNIKTMEGRDQIGEMCAATLDSVGPSAWAVEGDVTEADGTCEAWLYFETKSVRGKGHLRLKEGGAFTLLTTAKEIIGHEEKIGDRRDNGVDHGAFKDRENWAGKKARKERELGYGENQPFVVIIGGGQGGIGLGARLQVLGVPTIIVESNERAGDSWRKRYKSLCLHDPVWYDHMPYIEFPKNWPVFSPKDKIGDWLESYVKLMELTYWTRSKATSCAYDAAKKEWTVQVDRNNEKVTLRPAHVVLATGMSGFANMPTYPGMEKFKGDIFHSSKHPGGESYVGRNAVVIGSNNSSHDICADFWECGAKTTMLQRSTTHIAKSETLMDVVLGPLYSEQALANGVTHHMADLIFASIPYKVLPAIQKGGCDEIKKRDADYYKRIEASGFKLDFGADDTGLFMKYLRRGSGYYIDVGACELIANGSVKHKFGEVKEFTETSVVMKDGTELPADVVVCATGYGSMNQWAAKLISQEVADKVGKCWGLGSDTTKDPGPWEGELRNMWKPTQQENLWFHGGNLHQSRHYSQFLSIQLKARQVGIPTPVYGLAPVYHKC